MAAVTPDGKAQGALCRNVNSVWPARPHLSQDVRAGPQGKSDFRITWRRNAEHPLRGDHANFMSRLGEMVDCGLERCNNAIGLGSPGVRCNCNSHAAPGRHSAVARRATPAPCGQRSSSSSPFCFSTTAEQDSTQSPVLQ